MDPETIHQVMNAYIANQELAGGALIVRKNDEIVFDGKWGFADVSKEIPISEDTIFRMASMTKCVIGVAVMKMVEDGILALDDPICRYIPAFSDMRVCNDSRYTFRKGLGMIKTLIHIPFFRMDKVRTVSANRKITIRDLLSHASGLEMGVAGYLGMMRRDSKDTLKERVEKYCDFVLDFQPGMGTGYSPCASFDVLAYLLEVVSGVPVAQYLKVNLFEPLEMGSATFKLTDEQKHFLARTYTRKMGKLVDTTGTAKDLDGILRQTPDTNYVSGGGGLFCTTKDYEKMVRMLCNQGMYNGKQFLKPETVQLMHTEAQQNHLEPEPGYTWGLSVKIRQDPVLGGSACREGTYGWSGAMGTHFFVSPEDRIEAVFATHRTDLGGSGSYISRKVEELVFGIWGK